MTQELTARQETAIATYDGVGGEPDPSDFAIPYVTLVQASSDAVKQRTAQAGTFLFTDGEQREYIDFVPLHIQFTRDFYDKQGQKNICGSKDRIQGYPRDLSFFRTHGNLDVSEGVPLACRDCPFYEWAPSDKLACQKGYVVTCYDLTSEQPFMFRVRGTAVTPFKNRFIGAVAMGRAKPWARSFQMTAVLAQSTGNSWFKPQLQPIEGFDAERMAQWEAYASGLVAPSAHAEEELPFED